MNPRSMRAKATKQMTQYVKSQYTEGNYPVRVGFRILTPLWSESYEKRAALKIEFYNGAYYRMTGSYRRIYRIWRKLHATYNRCL